MTSATPPMIATRSASWGDIGVRLSESRYIMPLPRTSPVDFQSPKSDRPGRARLLAAAPHPLERVDGQHRPQHAPHEREERQRQRHVQQDGDDRLAQHEHAYAGLDLEHEADRGD